MQLSFVKLRFREQYRCGSHGDTACSCLEMELLSLLLILGVSAVSDDVNTQHLGAARAHQSSGGKLAVALLR